jgi:predicted amidohydrolase YtcJ
MTNDKQQARGGRRGSSDGSVDTVFVNGTVLTVDTNDREAEAVAVQGGRIIAVGGSAEIIKLRKPSTTVVDLNGRSLMPGLTDAHVHLADDGANRLHALDVRDFYTNVASVADILDKIAIHAKQQAPDDWIVASGSPIQQMRMVEGRLPHRRELDKVSPNNPLIVTFGAHITIANSAALAKAGITMDTPDPAGGHIDRDEANNELTGKLVERAQMMIRKVIGNKMAVAQDPRGDVGNIKQGIRNAAQQCLSRGVTTVHDIMKSGATIRAYQEMARDGELPFRVDMLVRVIEASYGTDHLLDLGIVTGFGNDWLKIGGVKLSIDGGITGHAAAFHEPYADADDPCDCGLIRIEHDELDSVVDRYHRAGHRICIHAIGDRAMDMAIDSFGKAIGAKPRLDHRHRVEHLGNWMMTPERLQKVKSLGLLPVPNMSFLYYIHESLMTYLGKSRMSHSFPLKSMMDAGLPLITGSDGPGYWPVDALNDVAVAVSRRVRKGYEADPAESIELKQAIRMVTANAAFSGFAEKIKGSIEVGKLADFAILAKNPYDVDAARIRDIQVDMTVLDGEAVYQAPGVELRK